MRSNRVLDQKSDKITILVAQELVNQLVTKLWRSNQKLHQSAIALQITHLKNRIGYWVNGQIFEFRWFQLGNYRIGNVFKGFCETLRYFAVSLGSLSLLVLSTIETLAAPRI